MNIIRENLEKVRHFILTFFIIFLIPCYLSVAQNDMLSIIQPHSDSVIINPFLQWGTFYGGHQHINFTYGKGIISDDSINTYIIGYTNCSENIATMGSYQQTLLGSSDAFLLKFDSNGNRIWGTYFGGTGSEDGNAIAIDNEGNLLFAGRTSSESGISTSGSYQSYKNGYSDGFIEKFTPGGSRIWGTYLGGNNNESIYSIAIDCNNNILVCGITRSDSALTTLGSWQSTYIGNTYGMGFFAKFDPNGSIFYCSYYGGEAWTEAWKITSDQENNIILGGQTDCYTNISSSGCQQPTFGGWVDGFLAKFNPSGQRLWGTYVGGNWGDGVFSICSDTNMNLYSTGYTLSINNIATPGAHKESIVGETGWDGFIIKYNPLGSRIWGTYFGGPSDDYITSVALDISNSEINCGGFSNSTIGVSTVGAHQEFWYFGISGNGWAYPDGYLTGFSLTGCQSWGTYIGGSKDDRVNFVTPNLFYVGDTGSDSSEFIVTPGCYQKYGYNRTNGFFGKFSTDFPSFITRNCNEEVKIKIVPNPCSENSCRIEFSDRISRVTVFSISGKAVFTAQGILDYCYMLDLSGMLSGLYLIKVESNKSTLFHKLLINR